MECGSSRIQKAIHHSSSHFHKQIKLIGMFDLTTDCVSHFFNHWYYVPFARTLDEWHTNAKNVCVCEWFLANGITLDQKIKTISTLLFFKRNTLLCIFIFRCYLAFSLAKAVSIRAVTTCAHQLILLLSLCKKSLYAQLFLMTFCYRFSLLCGTCFYFDFIFIRLFHFYHSIPLCLRIKRWNKITNKKLCEGFWMPMTE